MPEPWVTVWRRVSFVIITATLASLVTTPGTEEARGNCCDNDEGGFGAGLDVSHVQYPLLVGGRCTRVDGRVSKVMSCAVVSEGCCGRAVLWRSCPY
jgi:hypothetical protein